MKQKHQSAPILEGIVRYQRAGVLPFSTPRTPVRASFMFYNTREEADALVEAVAACTR